MKKLMVIAGLLGLIMFTQGAFAASATSTLSWTAPETRVDGTPMTVDEIAEYRIFYAVDGQSVGENDYVSITGDVTSKKITLDLAPKVGDYVVSFTATVVDTDGVESRPSEPVTKTFSVTSTARPNPPTSLTFSVVCGAECTIDEVTSE